MPAARPGVRRSSQRTTRTAILGLVAAALVVSGALPLQEYLAQRSEIAKLEQRQDAARERVAALEAERQRLQDPAYVTAEARRRLHFVLPGETAYILLGAPPAPVRAEEPSKVPGSPVGASAPWYSQLWGSVRTADRPPAPR